MKTQVRRDWTNRYVAIALKKKSIALGLPSIIREFSSGGCAWVGVGGENM